MVCSCGAPWPVAGFGRKYVCGGSRGIYRGLLFRRLARLYVVNVSVLGRKCVVWQDMVCRFDVSPDFAGSLYGMLPVLTGTLSYGLWKVFFLRQVCCVHTWFQFFQRVSIAGSRSVWFIYFSGGPLQMPKCPIYWSLFSELL